MHRWLKKSKIGHFNHAWLKFCSYRLVEFLTSTNSFYPLNIVWQIVCTLLILSSDRLLLQNMKTSVCSILNSSLTADVFLFCNRSLLTDIQRVQTVLTVEFYAKFQQNSAKFQLYICWVFTNKHARTLNVLFFCTTCRQNTSKIFENVVQQTVQRNIWSWNMPF